MMNSEELMDLLHPGDIFCSRNPMWLGRVITWFEKLRAEDNQAEYSHAGIVVEQPDTTFEALWTNRKQNLFKAYSGTRVLIGRHEYMTPGRAARGWESIKKYEGKWYAGWRLIFHALPFCSKVGTGNFAVCSEMVGKFISKSGALVAGCSPSDRAVQEFIRTGESFYWKGRTPDNIADMIRDHRGWSVVFEGVLP